MRIGCKWECIQAVLSDRNWHEGVQNVQKGVGGGVRSEEGNAPN